jgi:hypothetical protein
MAAKKSGRPGGSGGGNALPDPRRILERFYRVSGDMGAASLLQGDTQFGYALGAERTSEAMVAQVLPGGKHARYATIGHYDPTRGRWLFPAEYVSPGEQPAMAAHFKKRVANGGVYTGANIDAGNSAIDMFNPYTAKVRRDLAKIIRPWIHSGFLNRSSLRDALAEPGSPVVGIDDYTIVYPSMATRLTPEKEVEEVGAGDTITKTTEAGTHAGILLLNLNGVKVENDLAPGRTLRASRYIRLAELSPSRTWDVNTDIVTGFDVPFVDETIDRLYAAADGHPDFSLLHTAIVHGDEYAFTGRQQIDPI